MPHSLDPSAFILDDVVDFLAGDSRVLSFTLTDGNGNPVDVSNATIEYRWFEREYQTGDSAAVLTGDDADVEIVTDNRVDTTAGEFEIRLDPSATVDLYGDYYQKARVVQEDESEASWVGRINITA